jgi:dihydroxyacid dehydratase/phosphogluconate dehydratase
MACISGASHTCAELCPFVFVVRVLQQDAGMVGYRFNTIGVSDGISMGTDGMSFSLQSRDLIADSIETVMSAQVRL